MFACGGIMANFNTLALESVGEIAGTASSVSGFLQTSIGTGLSFLLRNNLMKQPSLIRQVFLS